MISIVFERGSQSNSKFNVLDTLVIIVHWVNMPVGFGKLAIKSRGRTLSVRAHLKRSIAEVKAEGNSLTHALIIVIANVDKDSKYVAFPKGRKILHVVQTLLETTGIDLSNGGGIPELARFQEYIRE